MRKSFNCIEFDDDIKQILILMGGTGSVLYKDIAKATVLNEAVAFKGKSEPFAHQVLGGPTVPIRALEQIFYVGIKLVLTDGSVKAIYVSNRAVRFNTKEFQEDTKEAEKIKHLLDNIIQKDHF